jgi:hypothetical protein
VSIDATIRQWSLDPKDLQQAKTRPDDTEKETEDDPNRPTLTEEEEALLDELMRDD